MSERDIDVPQLIELVKGRPIIWNRTLEEYKHKDKLHAAWKDVCQQLWPDYDNMDEMEKKHLLQLVKKKWCNARDHWQKCHKRLGKGAITIKKRKNYIFYNQMQFLEDTAASSVNTDTKDEPSFDDLSNIDEPEVVYNSPTQNTSEEQPSNFKRFKPNDPFTIPFGTNESHEYRHLMFFKSIIPSLRSFTEEQTIDFQLGVLQLVRSIRNQFPQLPTSSSYFSLNPQQLQTSEDNKDCYNNTTEKFQTTTSVTNGSQPQTIKRIASPAPTDQSDNSQFSESNF